MSAHEFDLNLIPVLAALLEKNSVSRAAESLGMTQSALSHALRRLRVYFDDALFVRSGTGIVPTPRALALAPLVDDLMARVRSDWMSAAGFNPQTTRRSFTLNMTDLAELVFLPRLLRCLREQAPGVHVQITRLFPSEVPAALERRDIDLAISSLPLSWEGLFQQQLARHRLVCMVSRDHPWFVGSVARQDYLAAQHIGVIPFGSDDDIFEWTLQAHGLKRQFFLKTQGFLILPSLIEGSPLIATVPEYMATAFGAHAGVRCLPLPIELPALALRQTWHARAQNDPANKWLRNTMFAIFSNDPVA